MKYFSKPLSYNTYIHYTYLVTNSEIYIVIHFKKNYFKLLVTYHLNILYMYLSVINIL